MIAQPNQESRLQRLGLESPDALRLVIARALRSLGYGLSSVLLGVFRHVRPLTDE